MIQIFVRLDDDLCYPTNYFRRTIHIVCINDHLTHYILQWCPYGKSFPKSRSYLLRHLLGQDIL